MPLALLDGAAAMIGVGVLDDP